MRLTVTRVVLGTKPQAAGSVSHKLTGSSLVTQCVYKRATARHCYWLAELVVNMVSYIIYINIRNNRITSHRRITIYFSPESDTLVPRQQLKTTCFCRGKRTGRAQCFQLLANQKRRKNHRKKGSKVIAWYTPDALGNSLDFFIIII